jgi:hypothetical protein
MRRAFGSFLIVPAVALALVWTACSSENVVVIKADAAANDASSTEKPDSRAEQPPVGTQTDSGVSGRRLGDRGCKVNEDCDSNNCFIAAVEADNFCTKNCTKASAATDCPKPLPGTCSRQLVCDPPE